jgi:hypothetical protein
MALTGKVPTPLNFGGMALNKNPSSGNAFKLHMCSTINTSLPNNMVCTGLLLLRVSSILCESMPTNLTPASTR